MTRQIWDYRNGKYQGAIKNGQLQGYGVFIDDDLTFYASNWQKGSLNGQTLVYVGHAKYIYGDWKNNQPSGLTVFRSGQAVLVGNFKRGEPVDKCLLIFERLNFACILEQQKDRDWMITSSGIIMNQQSLLQFVSMTQIPVPDHYFSLTKFADSLSHSSRVFKTYSCLNNYCYFGFPEGLSLIFNSINALVSIGFHRKQQLCEFGGKFNNGKSGEQGNFELGGEKIAYVGKRPSQKINSLFQKLHKRSLNFLNQYFDSRVKIFQSVESLLRSKLNQISEIYTNEGKRNIDLSESLDYQDLNEQDSIQINNIREKLYGTKDQTHTFKQISSYKKKQQNIHIDEISEEDQKQHEQFLQFDYQGEEQTFRKKPITKNQNKHLKMTHISGIEKNIKSKSFQKTQPHKKDNNLYRQRQTQQQNVKYQLTPQRILNSKTQSNRNEKSGVKMKSNNHKYVMTSDLSKSQQKLNASSIKSNNIYKQVKISQNEQIKQSTQKSMPTFKGLAEQNQMSRRQLSASKHSAQEMTFYFNNNIEGSREKPPKQRKSSDEVKATKANTLSKPVYQDIQERRKRILQQYHALNQNIKQHPVVQSKQPQDKKQLKRNFQSPYANLNLGAPTQFHQSSGSLAHIPLSIHNRQKQFQQNSPNKLIQLQQKYNYERKRQVYANNENIQEQKINSFAKITLPYKKISVNQTSNKIGKQNENKDIRNNMKYLDDDNYNMSPQPQNRSPACQKVTQKPKRSYQYLYD